MGDGDFITAPPPTLTINFSATKKGDFYKVICSYASIGDVLLFFGLGRSKLSFLEILAFWKIRKKRVLYKGGFTQT